MAKKILGHMKMSKPKTFEEKFGSNDDSEKLAAKIQNDIANKNSPNVPMVEEEIVSETKEEHKEKINTPKASEIIATSNVARDAIVEGEKKSKAEKNLDRILALPDMKGGAVTINLSLNKEVRNKFVKLSIQKGLKDDVELDKYSVLRAVLYDYINSEYDKIIENL